MNNVKTIRLNELYLVSVCPLKVANLHRSAQCVLICLKTARNSFQTAIIDSEILLIALEKGRSISTTLTLRLSVKLFVCLLS